MNYSGNHTVTLARSACISGIRSRLRGEKAKLLSKDEEIEWEYVFAAFGYVVGFGSIAWTLLFCISLRERYFEKIEKVMNVSHNKLVGEIPIGPQIQIFPVDCFEGNIGLCGLPLSVSYIKPLASPPNAISDGTTEIDWDYVFAVVGYVVGFGSFLWVLIFRRSLRERERYFEKIEDVF